MKPMCIGCGKAPGQLSEYLEASWESGFDDVDAYVRAEEGTYNNINGHFLCTPCYVKAGMPSSPRGWKAP